MIGLNQIQVELVYLIQLLYFISHPRVSVHEFEVGQEFGLLRRAHLLEPVLIELRVGSNRLPEANVFEGPIELF